MGVRGYREYHGGFKGYKDAKMIHALAKQLLRQMQRRWGRRERTRNVG
jgi:hypothetical protein